MHPGGAGGNLYSGRRHRQHAYLRAVLGRLYGHSSRRRTRRFHEPTATLSAAWAMWIATVYLASPAVAAASAIAGRIADPAKI